MKRFSIVIFVVFLLSNLMFAYEAGGDPFGGGDGFGDAPATPRRQTRTTTDRAQRLEQMKADASEAHRNVQSLIGKLAAIAIEGEEITIEMKRELGKELLEARKGLRYMTPEQKSDVFVADAWLGYVEEGNLEQSTKKCLTATKLSPKSDIAYMSLSLFSVLSSQQPPEREYFLQRVKDDDVTPLTQISLPFEVDYNERMFALVGKNIADIAISQQYCPTENRKYLNCIYMWQNEYSSLTKEQQLYTDQNESMVALAKSTPKPEPDKVKKNLAFFVELAKENIDREDFATFCINTDTKVKQAHKLIESLKYEGAIFVEQNNDEKIVMSTIPKELGSWSTILGPVVLVFDRDGVIKYAGSQFGIVFQLFVESQMEGIKFPKIEGITLPTISQDPFGGQAMDPFGGDPFGGDPFGSTDPFAGVERKPEPKPEPVKSADPNTPAEVAPADKAAETVVLSPEDEIQAQKLVEKANMLRKSYTRLGSSNSVVDTCNEIIRRYPGTVYAQRAREIYESIPEHQRKNHKLEE